MTMKEKFIALTPEITVNIDEILKIEQKEIIPWDDVPSKFRVFVTLRSDRENPVYIEYTSQGEAKAVHSRLRKHLAEHASLIDLRSDMPPEDS